MVTSGYWPVFRKKESVLPPSEVNNQMETKQTFLFSTEVESKLSPPPPPQPQKQINQMKAKQTFLF